MIEQNADSFPRSRKARRASMSGAAEIDQRREVRRFAIGAPPWGVYDDSIRSFAATFADLLGLRVVLPVIEYGSINDLTNISNELAIYLRERFPEENIVVVELGGPGGNLCKGIDNALSVAQSIGVTLMNPPNYSPPPFHTVIAGDLNRAETYDHIITELGGQRAHLIISRMFAGRDGLGRDPYFFGTQLAKMYEDVLSKDGVMMLQLPPWAVPFALKWADVANTNGLRVRVIGENCLIERDEGSPATLPLLTLAHIKQLYGRE